MSYEIHWLGLAACSLPSVDLHVFAYQGTQRHTNLRIAFR